MWWGISSRNWGRMRRAQILLAARGGANDAEAQGSKSVLRFTAPNAVLSLATRDELSEGHGLGYDAQDGYRGVGTEAEHDEAGARLQYLSYLLRNMMINGPNKVVGGGHHLSADRPLLSLCRCHHRWAIRAVLARPISNTRDTSFCLAALDDALARFGSHLDKARAKFGVHSLRQAVVLLPESKYRKQAKALHNRRRR